MAKQQDSEHEGGSNQGGRHACDEGVAPKRCDDEDVADPSPPHGQQFLEEEGLYHQGDDADVESR